MVETQERDGALIFAVRVQPRASKDEIAGEMGGALKVRLRAPAAEDRAKTPARRGWRAEQRPTRAGGRSRENGVDFRWSLRKGACDEQPGFSAGRELSRPFVERDLFRSR